MDRAKYKFFKNHEIFKLSLNYKLTAAEKNLVRLDLRELLDKKCNEDIDERSLSDIWKRMYESGHGHLIYNFFKQFFYPTDQIKNTFLIYGKSNTGKT